MAMASMRQAIETAMAAVNRGDFGQALAIARAVAEKHPGDPNALQIIGLSLAKQGRIEEAIDAFKRADRSAPNHPPILNTLGALLKDLGDYDAAKSFLLRASRLAPGLAQAHRNLAELYEISGDLKNARASHEEALKADPRNAESWGCLAHFLEERHDLEGARKCAERAIAINPHQANAHMALAEMEARAGDHAAVIFRIRSLLTNSAPTPVNRAKLCGLLSRALEKTNQYGDAFTAAKEANGLLRERNRARMERTPSPRSPDNIARMTDFFAAANPANWAPHEKLEGPAPVFSMGFPRSGTTLLDQILSSCDNVFVLEEKATLADAGSDFIMMKGGLERLENLTTREINHYRALYWKRAQAEAKNAPANAVFIDKLPLHTVMLGLIWRLFPDARIIFSLRDPRDVVLSCFQQTFGMNVAMYQFLDLKSAASYYDRVMRLADICRQKFPYRIHDVRYERIVTDFRNEIESVLNFLDLPWTERVERFAETARGRQISTPSAKQVIHGLYASSSGKWRNYRTEMANVLPLLAGWAQRFGYSE
jgi:Flp pilus assembly protein TadD